MSRELPSKTWADYIGEQKQNASFEPEPAQAENRAGHDDTAGGEV